MSDSSVQVRLSLIWLGDCWRVQTASGNYWDLKPDMSNFKQAIAGLIKKDINVLLATLPGDDK